MSARRMAFMRVLVSLPLRFQPGEHVGVQADIDAFFRLRHLELGAPPEVGISFRDVRIVEGLVRYRLNALEPDLSRDS